MTRASIGLITSSQGVWVPRVVLTGTGSGAPAVLLSQLLFLFRPDPEGELVKADSDWFESTGLSSDQVLRARAKLVDKGFVVCGKRRVDGSMTTVYALNLDALDTLISEASTAASTPRVRGVAHRELATSTSLLTGVRDIGRAPRHRSNKGVPENFTVTNEMRAWARTKAPSVVVDNQTEKFIDYHTAKGSTYKDWVAAWRTWMRNAEEYAQRDRARDEEPGYVVH